METGPLLPSDAPIELEAHWKEAARAVLLEGDGAAHLRALPAESVALVVTSPPYNLNKSYEAASDLDTYLAGFGCILDEIKRVLAPNGSVCWQVGNYVNRGEVFPLDIYFYSLFKEQGFQLRNRIVWTFEHGLHASKRLSGRYETLLWWSKTGNYKFNLDAVRVPSKYPGKRHFKGDKIGQLSGNPLGKNPSDVWRIVEQEWDAPFWNIPNVKANHPEKTSHPCQFPIELAERCVLALTDADDIVLDPFCGAGSSLVAALKNDRRAIGCEKEAAYCDLTRSRIADLSAGRLKYRPLGRPIHQPTGREKVAQVPREWSEPKSENGNLFADAGKHE